MLNRAVDPSMLYSRPDVADSVIHLAAVGPSTGELNTSAREGWDSCWGGTSPLSSPSLKMTGSCWWVDRVSRGVLSAPHWQDFRFVVWKLLPFFWSFWDKIYFRHQVMNLSSRIFPQCPLTYLIITSQKYHAINSVHRGTLVLIDGIELIRNLKVVVGQMIRFNHDAWILGFPIITQLRRRVVAYPLPITRGLNRGWHPHLGSP